MAAVAEADSGLTVRELGATELAAWDRFVDRCPDATFFHRAGWREVIENAFGHPTWFYLAEGPDGIEGVLPLARVRSRLFGDALISLPFAVYGGVAASTERAAVALDSAAQELARSLDTGHLEYRNRAPRHPDWHTKDIYYTFRRAMHDDPDANLKDIPRKQRAMVRKGMGMGMQSALDDDTRRLFHAYSRSVHRLGTPVFPRRYFDLLQQTFGDDCEVLTLTKDGEIVASCLSFYFRDEVLPFYGGGTDAARRLYANDYLYWCVMERARERGCRLFDYGRSKIDTGSYRFKKHWGFEPEPLYYECQLVRSAQLPDNSPLNPKYRLFINLWQRLPLPVANALGPRIVRNLG